MHARVNYHNTLLLSINSVGVSIPFSLWVNDDIIRHFSFSSLNGVVSVTACGICLSKIS